MKISTMFNRIFMTAFISAIIATADAQPVAVLGSSQPCNRCSGKLLPGRRVPHPETKWGIISDLPESFSGYGVLYSTTPVLPYKGIPETMQKQVMRDGFAGIDDSFDVFFFHLLKQTTATARLVVYVRNNGSAPVQIHPSQVIKSEGTIGTMHQFETVLARRVLDHNWDVPPLAVDAVSIPAGHGRVIAAGKQFGNVQEDSPDASRNVNCFGYVRAKVSSAEKPKLDVYVIAIPIGPRDKMKVDAEKLLTTGVVSEDSVPMDRAPIGCAVGRAVGVYPNFTWQNNPVTIDIGTIPADRPTTFPMALPEIQTAGCADARQTTDLVMHPAYTRPETIGNYMIEYKVAITVTNSSATTRTFDYIFGKQEADVGLVYNLGVAKGNVWPVDFHDGKMQVQGHGWAGPKQAARESAFAKGLVLQPGESKIMALQFMICGNSSLPFYIGLIPK